jgi:ankyrin repeat protein
VGLTLWLCRVKRHMDGIWQAAKAGDVGEVERLVGQDPGLLDAEDGGVGRTPLMLASRQGHVGVVRWLLRKGAAINEADLADQTALLYACEEGRAPVVSLLLERGADPTIANYAGRTPLMVASCDGHLEVVRLLLGHPSAKMIINHRENDGETALWRACKYGHGGVARALLEIGADPTIADNEGTTPVAISKQHPSDARCAEGRRECVAALEVRSRL